MKIIYFSWVREKIGKPEEELSLPSSVKTITDLLDFLKQKDDVYLEAFKQPELIRVAIDHVYHEHDASIIDAKEIALFPPMTGG